MRRLFLLVSALLVIPACGGTSAGTRTAATPVVSEADATEETRDGPPEGWPRILEFVGGAEPALYYGPGADAPALGYVSDGVRARLESSPENGRVLVTVAGALSIRAWVPLTRLSAYVTQRGRVDGTPTYVAPGDRVSILGRNPDGSFRVSVAPWLGRSESDRLGPWEGTLPAASIATEAPERGELNPGENRLLGGGETAVYDRPGGTIIATIPPAEPQHVAVVLRSRGGWSGVRIGVGPYIVGYVQGELAAAAGAPSALYHPAELAEGAMPQRIADETGTLHRVAAGTRIRFVDRIVGRLRSEGWARAISQVGEGDADVYMAIDNGVAVRGLVPASALRAAPEGGATP